MGFSFPRFISHTHILLYPYSTLPIHPRWSSPLRNTRVWEDVVRCVNERRWAVRMFGAGWMDETNGWDDGLISDWLWIDKKQEADSFFFLCVQIPRGGVSINWWGNNVWRNSEFQTSFPSIISYSFTHSFVCSFVFFLCSYGLLASGAVGYTSRRSSIFLEDEGFLGIGRVVPWTLWESEMVCCVCVFFVEILCRFSEVWWG